MKKLVIILVVLVLAYFLGPKPEDPNYRTDFYSYSSSLQHLEDSLNEFETHYPVKPNNNSKIIWNDSIRQTEYCILYVHGYSASHVEGFPAHIDFAKRYGANLLLLRLPDHGIISENPMLNYNPDSLWESTKRGLALAQRLGKKVIVMSTSTGGTLSLKLASVFPEKIFALVNLSPNVHPQPFTAPLLNNHWGKTMAWIAMQGDFRILHNLKDHPEYDKYWYSKYRIESLVNMQQLVETTMTEETFKKITVPSLTLVYFKNDQERDDVIDVYDVFWMHEELSSPLKKLVKLPNAKTHPIGSSIFSKDLEGVEQNIFDFCDDELHMKAINPAITSSL